MQRGETNGRTTVPNTKDRVKLARGTLGPDDNRDLGNNRGRKKKEELIKNNQRRGKRDYEARKT